MIYTIHTNDIDIQFDSIYMVCNSTYDTYEKRRSLNESHTESELNME